MRRGGCNGRLVSECSRLVSGGPEGVIPEGRVYMEGRPLSAAQIDLIVSGDQTPV